MRLLPRDLNQKQIAAKLGISVRTVEMHLADIRSRLGARNTLHAMTIYFGYLDEPPPLPNPPERPARDELSGPLSPALRFEILVRDHFTCQYCGRKAPEAVLHVDHRLARARGGSNDRANLITSCRDCNLGKGSTTTEGSLLP